MTVQESVRRILIKLLAPSIQVQINRTGKNRKDSLHPFLETLIKGRHFYWLDVILFKWNWLTLQCGYFFTSTLKLNFNYFSNFFSVCHNNVNFSFHHFYCFLAKYLKCIEKISANFESHLYILNSLFSCTKPVSAIKWCNIGFLYYLLTLMLY